MPFVEKLARDNEARLRLVKVDAAKSRRLCMNLRLMSLPAFLFYKDGKEVERITGDGVTEEQLRETLAKLIK